MNRKPITSAHLKSIGFENNTLEIEFQDGSVWQYPEVSDAVWKLMEAAPSPGKFFLTAIKPTYKAVKIL